MTKLYRTTLMAAVAGIAGIAAAVIAGPADAAPSFKGKTITMIIGYRPGGGTDAVGRLLGDYLAAELPGKPKIIYRNMPGGGGVTSMNYFANQVKPDGLTITAGSSTQPDPSRFRRKSAKYNPLTFRYIGGVSRGATVLLINKKARSRLTDPSKKPVIMGGIDGTRSGNQMALWGKEFLGWNLRWVIGYPGTAEITLALRRGEIDLSSTANGFLIRELVSTGKIDLFVQSGTLTDGKLMPRGEFANTPLFPPMIASKITDPLAKQAFNYWKGINALDKFMALPPGTPDDIVKVYRTAFRAAAKNKKFISRGRKMISEDFAPVMPKDMEALIAMVANTSTEAVGFINKMKKKQKLPVDSGKKKYVKVKATLDDVRKGGRLLIFKVKGKTQSARVSSSQTKVKISGKKTKRKNLKAGMKCVINYPGNAKTAKSVTCK